LHGLQNDGSHGDLARAEYQIADPRGTEFPPEAANQTQWGLSLAV
jgi:hypothetical protein